MAKPVVNWEGVFVPKVTPFDRDGLIDEPAERDELRGVLEELGVR